MVVTRTPFRCPQTLITECPNELFTTSSQVATVTGIHLVEATPNKFNNTYATGYLALNFYVNGSTSRISVQSSTFVQIRTNGDRVVSLSAVDTNFISTLDINLLSRTYESCVVNYISGLNFLKFSNRSYPLLEDALRNRINFVNQNRGFRGVRQRYLGANGVVEDFYSNMPAQYSIRENYGTQLGCVMFFRTRMQISYQRITGMFESISQVNVWADPPQFSGTDASSDVFVEFFMRPDSVFLTGYVSLAYGNHQIVFSGRPFRAAVGAGLDPLKVSINFFMNGTVIGPREIRFTTQTPISVSVEGLFARPDVRFPSGQDDCQFRRAQRTFYRTAEEITTQVLGSTEFPLLMETLAESLTQFGIGDNSIVVPF